LLLSPDLGNNQARMLFSPLILPCLLNRCQRCGKENSALGKELIYVTIGPAYRQVSRVVYGNGREIEACKIRKKK
jgi:hypothetical protein